MTDELAEHLDSIARDDCYRVDAVMKCSPFETTERVYFVGANGSEQGPFVRKRLDGDAGLGEGYVRLQRAQRAGRRFRHLPRVVDCYSVGGQRVVVMEHVAGETLAEVVYRCDPSVALACDVFPRLCEAVRELHEGFDPPLIHRDLKPSNVMLTRDSLTIIDFGIAREFKEGSDEDTRRFGTRAYAPPEQFGFGQTDARSDVYALGMLLYFCLTEKTPDAKARKARFRSPQVPESLRAVIERATAFDPEARYAGVAELERAFVEAARALGGKEADAPELARAVAARRSLIDGIPLWVGTAWNVLLVLTFALFACAAASSAFRPMAGSAMAAESFAYRAATSAAILAFLFVPVLFILRDRRPVERYLPRVPRTRLRAELLAILFGFILCMLVYAALDLLGV